MDDQEIQSQITQEEEKDSLQQTKTNTGYSLPSSSPDVLVKILKAYAICTNYGESAAGYKDIAGVANLHPTMVSRNNAFFSDNGFIIFERRGLFKPSEGVIFYAKQVPWDEENANKFIHKIINDTWFGKVVSQLFQMNKEVSKEQIRKALGLKAMPNESQINNLPLLIDFLETFKYIVKTESGSYILKAGETSEPEDSEVEKIVDKVLSKNDYSGLERETINPKIKMTEKSGLIQINLNFNIPENFSSEHFDRVIEGIIKLRKALEHESNENNNDTIKK